MGTKSFCRRFVASSDILKTFYYGSRIMEPLVWFFQHFQNIKNYFMEKSKEVVEVLNDLVMIHNDRIAGYERAIKELKQDDNDLKTLFDQMIIESQQIKSDLAHEIQVLHGDVETGS